MATAKAKKVDETVSTEEVQGAIALKKGKREPDTSPVGRLLDAVRAYRRASRTTDPARLEQAREDERQARTRVAETAGDPSKQDEAIKDLRKAAGRIDRMVNKQNDRREKQLEALDNVQHIVDEIRASFGDSDPDGPMPEESESVKH